LRFDAGGGAATSPGKAVTKPAAVGVTPVRFITTPL
jgi:hypothetical protein